MTAEKTDPDKELLKKIGARIRDLRIERGYSNYEDCAYAFNINRVQFGRYETGQNLKFLSLVRLVRAFGITLEEFFSKGFED
ncbi:MAG: transcriptional regulator [Mucilaginibacter sp.]|nr:transcriptional regulator [Mucilaginibacter sp.]